MASGHQLHEVCSQCDLIQDLNRSIACKQSKKAPKDLQNWVTLFLLNECPREELSKKLQTVQEEKYLHSGAFSASALTCTVGSFTADVRALPNSAPPLALACTV